MILQLRPMDIVLKPIISLTHFSELKTPKYYPGTILQDATVLQVPQIVPILSNLLHFYRILYSCSGSIKINNQCDMHQ